MNFYILNFDDTTLDYVSRLNEAASRGEVQLEKIFVCNKAPVKPCKNMEIINQGGAEFLTGFLNSKKSPGFKKDQIVPSHDAPHVLAQVFKSLMENCGYECVLTDLPGKVGTPFDADLKAGLKAVSYSVGKCPLSCREEGICELSGEKRVWDIGKMVDEYAKKSRFEAALFPCLHLTGGVSTVPMKIIAEEWKKVKKILKKNPEKTKILIATHSRCHGIIALLSVHRR